MLDKESARINILIAATDALARAGYNGPSIERAKHSKVMQDRADTLFALSILNDRSAKGTEVGLMMELAQRRFWCIRKPESERLASMEGTTISRIIERTAGQDHGEEELTPLELAMTSFLLSHTVQSYQS